MALTHKAVLAADGNRKIADGNGLYLIVREGRKRWVYIFQRRGRRREMGLGAFPDVSLAEARAKHAEARACVLSGGDPIRERKVRDVTFGPFARGVLEERAVYWKPGSGSARSWRQSLSRLEAWEHRSLDEIDMLDVLRVLKPLWSTVPEAAHMVQMRAAIIFDAAIAEGLRQDANPARWKHGLDRHLPRRRTLSKGHFSALPYQEAPDFMREMETRSCPSSKALRLMILTAARSGMILGLRWEEVSEDAMTIPAARMKHGRDFVIPLSAQAKALLAEIPRIDDLVFPTRTGQALGRNGLGHLTRPFGVTAHGFRSTFKDWAQDMTDHDWETSEQALAHQVGDMTSRAYRRSSSLEKRRVLMQDWADFLSIRA